MFNTYLLITGICIGIERRRQDLRQELLCEDICSIKTLSIMEKGKSSVKNKTYERLSQRLGYEFDYNGDAMNQIFDLFNEVHYSKEYNILNDMDCLAQKAEAILNNDLTLKYFKQLFNEIVQHQTDINISIDKSLHEFIYLAYKYFPIKIQDLCLNFLYMHYNLTGDYHKSEEIVMKKEFIGNGFSANILCYLCHLAYSKNYFALINTFHSIESRWIKNKNYSTLLLGYENLLLPLFYTNQSDLEPYIKKCEDTFNMTWDGSTISDRYIIHNYNMGLVMIHMKNYKMAYEYLKKSLDADENKYLINRIMFEYVCGRLSSEDGNPVLSNIIYNYYEGSSRFKNEYNYYYYKNNNLLNAKDLQTYIISNILPNNMDGSEILYQVFLFEMLQLCNISKAYSQLKVYIEAVNH